MSFQTKGIIYYTDGLIQEPIKSWVLESIKASNLPIVSSSPETVGGERSIVTMMKQIHYCLKNSTTKYVFFCEHDVIYPKSHFDFTPPKDNIFYYNSNVWRWDYPKNRYITYDRLISLSGLCVNRKFALKHYEKRLEMIEEKGYNRDTNGEPSWARKMGYEPGTKKIKRGGFSDDDFETWQSAEPLIDIRHKDTFSPPKVSLDSFKHLPTNWREITL